MLILVLAYGADRGLEVANARAAETFIRTPVVWLNTVTLLVFSTIMLGLAWLTFLGGKCTKRFFGCS